VSNIHGTICCSKQQKTRRKYAIYLILWELVLLLLLRRPCWCWRRRSVMLSTLHACYLAATWRATLVWECRMGHLYPPFFLLFFFPPFWHRAYGDLRRASLHIGWLSWFFHGLAPVVPPGLTSSTYFLWVWPCSSS